MRDIETGYEPTKWIEIADAYALEQFCIDAAEMNGGNPININIIENWDDPVEWVDWIGEKYNLTRIDRLWSA